jgi:hypothetical protein
MSSFYLLRINTTKEVGVKLSSEFKHSSVNLEPYLELEIKDDSVLFNTAINYFIDLIEKHEELLAHLGVNGEDITLWYLYEYEEQCNMEFEPNDLKRMGDNNIALCISCWKK